MTAAKMVQDWQIRTIWAIANNLGIDKDDVHAMAESESLKNISFAKANEILDRLRKEQGSYTPPKKDKKQHSEVAGMATEGQQRKVWALMYQLQKYDKTVNTASLGERLCGIIKKELKVTAKPSTPFAWLNFNSTNKLIEILKKYVDSASKKAVQ